MPQKERARERADKRESESERGSIPIPGFVFATCSATASINRPWFCMMPAQVLVPIGRRVEVEEWRGEVWHAAFGIVNFS